jgi:hypothetical protein
VFLEILGDNIKLGGVVCDRDTVLDVGGSGKQCRIRPGLPRWVSAEGGLETRYVDMLTCWDGGGAFWAATAA